MLQWIEWVDKAGIPTTSQMPPGNTENTIFFGLYDKATANATANSLEDEAVFLNPFK